MSPARCRAVMRFRRPARELGSRLCACSASSCAWAAAEEAEVLALFDEGPGHRDWDAGGDRAELEVDRLEDRGSHQEVLERRGQVADDLLGEVVVEVALGAAQGADEGARLNRI